MSNLYVNRGSNCLREDFWIVDENGNERYLINGCGSKLPKRIIFSDKDGKEVARINHKAGSVSNKFHIEVAGTRIGTVGIKMSIKAPYQLDSTDYSIDGNFINPEFEVIKNDRKIGRINKEDSTMKDRYLVSVDDEQEELAILAIVIAVDCIKLYQDIKLKKQSFDQF